MGAVLESTDLKNKLEDLSGVVLKPGENPYNALIEACKDDPVGQFHVWTSGLHEWESLLSVCAFPTRNGISRNSLGGTD